MNKEQYLIEQFKNRFPEIFKEEEMSYMLNTIKSINSRRHFEEFLEKLNNS